MTPNTPALTVAALAATLALTPAAAAAQPPSFLTGKFRVEVEGVQTTTWKTNHVKQFDCDSNVVGSGREAVRFTSKPAVVTLAKFGKATPIVHLRRKSPTLTLRSRITRNGQRTESGAAICSYGDGTGGTPPAPDCGTKRSELTADLGYVHGRNDVIGLEQTLALPLATFRNCPVGGVSWPTLLDRVNSGQIGARMPVRDLFKYGKNIVVGRGRDLYEDGDTQATTTIRWSISLTRVGGPKRAGR